MTSCRTTRIMEFMPQGVPVDSAEVAQNNGATKRISMRVQTETLTCKLSPQKGDFPCIR